MITHRPFAIIRWIAFGVLSIFLPIEFTALNAWAKAPSAVIFNEIHYHPASQNPLEEFIELYNRSSESVNLTGWQITGGIRFAFTNNVIASGAFLVIAADVDVFRRVHPSTDNIAGNWTGSLNNGSDSLELLDAGGVKADEIRYADDGDWGVRIRDQVDYGHRGWDWSSPADGGGYSLELVNPGMPGKYGQNWKAGVAQNGTPGNTNSVWSTNTAPLILGLRHSPPIPRSNEKVCVTALVVDESGSIASVRLFHRLDGMPFFEHAPMFDDGYHGDGAASDGIYGAYLPAQTNQSIIEFYIEAHDREGNGRTWPAAASDDGLPVQTQNALYLVSDESSAASQSIYWLIVKAADMKEIEQIQSLSSESPYPNPDVIPQNYSHARFNTTFIGRDSADMGMDIRYAISVQNRGSNSRLRKPPSYRVNFQNSNPWKGLQAINLNSQYTHCQIAGSVLYRHAGLPAAMSRPVLLRVNGQNYTSADPPSFGVYACNEVLDSDFAKRNFPTDSDGNIYKCARWGNIFASLDYRGNNPDPYRPYYGKETNVSEDDYSDLIELTRVFSALSANSDIGEFERVIHPRLWMRYFALETLVVNMESSLGNGYNGLGEGDDYSLYFGKKDARAVVLPYDLDTIMGQGDSPARIDESLFRAAANPRIARFLQSQQYAPLYYEELLTHLNQTMTPEILHPLMDQAVGNFTPQAYLNLMKQFMNQRNAYVRSQIPEVISIGVDLPFVDGRYQAATNFISLRGRANAIRTRSIIVNGIEAAWSAWQASWLSGQHSLHPGLNQLTVCSLDAAGTCFESKTVEILCNTKTAIPAPSEIRSNTFWKASEGPYWVQQSLLVSADATLQIEPGTTVFFAPDAKMIVLGRLQADGVETNRIHLGLQPGSSRPWAGIELSGLSSTHSLSFVTLEGCGSKPAIQAAQTSFNLSHVQFSNIEGTCIQAAECSFAIQDSAFPGQHDSPVIAISGLVSDGIGVIARNVFGKTASSQGIIQFINGRPDNRILQITSNHFDGGNGSAVQLTDASAFIDGNVFQHIRSGNTQNSLAGAILVSSQSPNPVQLTIIRNFFHDCDCMIQSYGNALLSVENNTATHLAQAAIILNSGTCVLDGNIIWETPINAIAEAASSGTNRTSITFQRCILSGPDHRGNECISLDPAFVNPPDSPTNRVRVEDFHLERNSPAIGTGPDGLDMGACVPSGITLNEDSSAWSFQSNLVLRVAGPGITHYRYRLDGGPFSQEQAISQELSLQGVTPGLHLIEVIGKYGTGEWQTNAPASKTWQAVTNQAYTSPIRINEVFAVSSNSSSPENQPNGMIELYNGSDVPLELGGLSLSPDPATPDAYVFQTGKQISGHGFLVLSDNPAQDGNSIAMPFRLSASGGRLYLFDTPEKGRRIIDSITFGRQLPNHSIGRLADGSWGLAVPTPNKRNIAQPLAAARQLKINEWMTANAACSSTEFVELFNPGSLPINLGGLTLQPRESFQPGLPAYPSLSFIDAGEAMLAVGSGQYSGIQPAIPELKLSSEQGVIGLFDALGNRIDVVFLDAQLARQSQGRSPDGESSIGFFSSPTPGTRNARFFSSAAATPSGLPIRIHEMLCHIAKNGPEQEQFGWIELFNPSTVAVNLDDMSLGTNANTPRQWIFPQNTVLRPGRYLTIACDPGSPASSENTGLDLPQSGGVVCLFSSSSEGSRLLDALYYGLQIPGYSLGRNNTGAWSLANPSPSAPNTPAVTGSQNRLRLNEWMAAPNAGPDWFELHNADLQPVSLDGLFLTDDLQQKRLFSIAPLSFIGTGKSAFQLFRADSAPENGASHVGFKLGADGEFLGIFDASDRQIDAVHFSRQSLGVSQGRYPDGASTLVFFQSHPTPGSANQPDSDSADSDGDGIPDYWENAFGLNPANPGDASLDLDRDGLTNLQEYQSGTDPSNSSSYLGFLSLEWHLDGFLMTFLATAGRQYSIEYRDDMTQGAWHLLTSIGPLYSSQEMNCKDAAQVQTRYYRLSVKGLSTDPQ